MTASIGVIAMRCPMTIQRSLERPWQRFTADSVRRSAKSPHPKE